MAGTPTEFAALPMKRRRRKRFKPDRGGPGRWMWSAGVLVEHRDVARSGLERQLIDWMASPKSWNRQPDRRGRYRGAVARALAQPFGELCGSDWPTALRCGQTGNSAHCGH